jgi:hypothetical protein
MSVDVPERLMGPGFVAGSLGWLCSLLPSLLGSSNPDVVFGSALATIGILNQYCSMTVDALTDKRLLLFESGFVD